MGNLQMCMLFPFVGKAKIMEEKMVQKLQEDVEMDDWLDADQIGSLSKFSVESLRPRWLFWRLTSENTLNMFRSPDFFSNSAQSCRNIEDSRNDYNLTHGSHGIKNFQNHGTK